ncbi:MAG: imidazolonepropionase [Oligoflexia bacterium]|nr:imidazolonepropionase [Oligoflexia bacterium]
MKIKVYKNISCLVTNEGIVAKKGIRPKQDDLGIIFDGCLVIQNNKIIWTGKTKNLPSSFKKNTTLIDCKGLTAYPGLVDCHTHPIFSGDRSREFELRMQGSTYQEIAAAGGGIWSTVLATRKSSLAELTTLAEDRFKKISELGVRLLEAKSGYGLNLKDEIKSLEAIKKAKKSNLEIVSTCLAAHAYPRDWKEDKKEYISYLKEIVFPTVKKKNLAEYIDVFCDTGYFSVEDTLSLMDSAIGLGFSVRLHGEELDHTGIAEKAPKKGCHSIDHLLKISDQGIIEMAKHETVATLLPATSFYLRESPAPARKLIDSGVVVALASDFNPGSSPTLNLPLVGTFAAVQLGMSTAEIIAGITWNAAKSLRKESYYGALLPGFKGLPVFCEGDHPSALFYRFGYNQFLDPRKRTK